jgi:hypothetical protein
MGLADELAKLAELHRTGALSDAEYGAAKARLIEGAPATTEVQHPVPQSVPVAPPKDSDAPPKWMKPWGWFLVWLGALGFGASAYVNWRTDHEMAALLAGLLNPMFFIGMPIGLYWLVRSGVTVDGVLTAINHSTLSEEEKRRRGL